MDDIDLFVGATMEKKLREDALLGPVFTCILVFDVNNNRFHIKLLTFIMFIGRPVPATEGRGQVLLREWRVPPVQVQLGSA